MHDLLTKILAATALAATAAPAQEPGNAPRLVVLVSVDQLATWVFEATRPHFADDGGFGLIAPTEHGVAPITAVHDPGLLAFLREAWAISALAADLEAMARMALGEGPMNTMPSSAQAWAKSAFSDRKP